MRAARRAHAHHAAIVTHQARDTLARRRARRALRRLTPRRARPLLRLAVQARRALAAALTPLPLRRLSGERAHSRIAAQRQRAARAGQAQPGQAGQAPAAQVDGFAGVLPAGQAAARPQQRGSVVAQPEADPAAQPVNFRGGGLVDSR